MAWYNPKSWGRADKEAAQDEPQQPKESDQGDFSTDLTRYRSMKTAALNAWIGENMFQRTAKDFRPVNAKGVAMDTATAMDSDIKSAYAMSANNLPQVLFSWYVQQGFIGYQACSIIAQNALVNKACTKPAQKALKKGYNLTVNDGSDIDADVLAEIRKSDKRFKIKKNLVEFERMNRIFGIRIAIFKVNSPDPDYYLKPFNIDGVKAGSYKGIAQVDPYWITPELNEEATSDPSSRDFYEPTWWRVNGKRYHKSHLVITRYAEVPDLLKPSYIYGGLPLPQLVYERIYSAERTANEAPMLALTKRTNVMKTNIKAAMANQRATEQRLQVFNEFRDNHGILLVDKDEDYQQSDTALSDLDSVIMTQYQLVAALAGMPATELIETSPKGFNATGEFEKQSWYDNLEAIQEDSFTPLLDRHYQLLIKSEIAPKLGINPFGVDVEWKPLDSPTPKEIAEINSLSSVSDQVLQSIGAVDAFEVRDRLISDPLSGYNGLMPFEDSEGEQLTGGENDET